MFGNPHSINPTSAASTELVERARDRVLDFFNASPEEYVAIFTPNATGALRLVGEAYPFRAGDRFLLTFDNHNSVNGIREFARARGAQTTYIPSVAPDLRVDAELLPRYLTDTARRPSQPVRLPGAVELLRRPAPARVDRAGASPRLGRAARRGRLRPDQPPRPEPLAPGLRGALVLQDVRLADRRRLPARAARGARQARATVVLGRDDRGRVRPARVLPVRARRGALRGRHGQLPQPARRRDRTATSRPDRDRHDPRARQRARRLAARCARLARATATARRRRPSTGRGRASGAARRSPSTSCTRTAAWSTSATSTASPRRTRSRCAPAASATPARARSRSRSRARRWSAASSGRA